MPASSSKRKRRKRDKESVFFIPFKTRIESAKKGTRLLPLFAPRIKSDDGAPMKDGRFRAAVIGKSHDPRDIDIRRRVDTEMDEAEAVKHAGWGPGHIGN